MRAHPSQGHAYVEFENPEEAVKALKHMDRGQIDGRRITATAVLTPPAPATPRRLSPPRRMLPPLSTWRRLRRSRSRSPWGRSPERRLPRYPRRPRHWSGPSSSSLRSNDVILDYLQMMMYLTLLGGQVSGTLDRFLGQGNKLASKSFSEENVSKERVPS
ncbi:unnamed protein product [Rangifer tarandus platyrhynchus]|uniref:RRM domain-containing protein n=1 Tax=Rangifer tarandus platyrhynchus TaxID=3082113 RepID=A0ABN8ZAQ5_RANTA|nr:unnamed protein product [Rangifer tarandus platyrhynchus]CAI9688310.1 unnamed protein product [Rangifer tarandus platyrhynchus]